MGATFPLGMLAIKKYFPDGSHASFSFLYVANLLGAIAGALVPLLLIELYGFQHTLYFGGILNLGIALSASIIKPLGKQAASSAMPATHGTVRTSSAIVSQYTLLLLFISGLTSMGVEVVWVRLFTPFLGTVVYAFAGILSTYLAATFVGSYIYRNKGYLVVAGNNVVWLCLAIAMLTPLVATLPGIPVDDVVRLFLGIGPASIILGFMTPMLVDRWSDGKPEKAGLAYAVNIAGCILGPLLAGFVVLTVVDERWALYLFSLPWFVAGILPQSWDSLLPRKIEYNLAAVLIVILAFLLVLACPGYPGNSAIYQVRRDNTATVVASNGRNKSLIINGVSMTGLTPITKLMGHLSLAFLDHKPTSALVVCFGMGTTYRSLMSWNIETTAVELVPSVPQLFGFFHADGMQLIQSPRSHIVIDDGRRFLEHSAATYDVITIDPPPPVEAAASSLLYSKEFYAIAKKRLKPNGILQQWLEPCGETFQVAVTRAIMESFPYVRIFRSFNEEGLHFIASNKPILLRSAAELAAKLPAKAALDIVEWGPNKTVVKQFSEILRNEVSPAEIIAKKPFITALQDDKPINEYFLLRYIS
jgi:spermidine synthase